MKTPNGLRCDVCTAVCKPGDEKKFFPFFATMVKGYRKGVAQFAELTVPSNGKNAVELHACPTCKDKVRSYAQSPSIAKLQDFPHHGFLRRALAKLTLKYPHGVPIMVPGKENDDD